MNSEEARAMITPTKSMFRVKMATLYTEDDFDGPGITGSIRWRSHVKHPRILILGDDESIKE